ncbi:hypothetical protein Ddye_000269 [Dipteronia dyeriana]|uniref:Uncharacterized protein n=1 Tax=Dipteronia dyeriana TaxID=168575 RepID=A0AAD9XLL0_9ROSI|nr:hypothetical protein Ddye_000269 [Dipteronia dyeriana]
MNVDSSKGFETCSSAKRGRADHDVLGSNDIEANQVRKEAVGSFKSKLMSMSTPNFWSGFRTTKEKLKIDIEDNVILEGVNGLTMKLSPKLKEQLHKAWENAIILKNMGGPHAMNFMINKLTHKWSLLGH